MSGYCELSRASCALLWHRSCNKPGTDGCKHKEEMRRLDESEENMRYTNREKERR